MGRYLAWAMIAVVVLGLFWLAMVATDPTGDGSIDTGRINTTVEEDR